MVNKVLSRKTAKAIIEHGVNWGEVRKMLLKAYDSGYCNEKRGRVNKSFSRAVSFNLLWPYVKNQRKTNNVTVVMGINYFLEFGQYWGGWKPPARTEKDYPKIHHSECINPYRDK